MHIKHKNQLTRKPEIKYSLVVGADREGDTPVPIPNTEVKTLIADGTAEFALWESRTVPCCYINK